jgi:hypothetical protein
MRRRQTSLLFQETDTGMEILGYTRTRDEASRPLTRVAVAVSVTGALAQP